MSYNDRSAELLLQIIVQIEGNLIACGIEKEKAETAAHDTCEYLRKTFGGTPFYFPKGSSIDVMMKHHKIYQAFTGHNHAELAKQFDTSIQNVYRIVKIAYKEELAEKQPQLF